MKRLILLFTLLSIVWSLSIAQSMTDSQVVDYVKQRNAMGANQTTIAAELMERGATREQLLRLKQNYEAQAKNAQSAEYTTLDRSRFNNGESANVPDEEPNLTATEENKVKIFGHDIFRQKMLSFEPNMAIAVPTNYVLGPGDEVIIDIFGDSQRSDKQKIAPDGSITLEHAGPVQLSGLTASQAQSTVSARLRPYYAGSKFKVSVGQTRTITVNVMGEVLTPGSFTLSAFASVFHALYQAGGISDIGTLRDIKVCRGSRVVAHVDIYDYILNGQLSGNILLRDGDVILVDTYQDLVEVRGWVKRPMYYETRSGESLRSVLDYAGGFKGGAYTETVNVARRKNTQSFVFTPEEDAFSNFLLTDGDIVTVTTSETRLANAAEISGAVFRPGTYEIGENVQTVRSLIEQAGGLKEDALRERAVLLRMKPDRSREALAIDIDAIMAGTTGDVVLRNEDLLTISSREKQISEQHLRIDGEVYNPGEYHYADNLTVEDLIVMAGGLRESASLLNVEVSRRIVNPEGNEDKEQRAEIYNIELKSGLGLLTQTGFRLAPYDEVYVRKSPEYSEQRGVWVRGEVLFEGRYVLENQNERLSDIMKRTGGTTSKASIQDARLKRTMNETELLRREKLIKKVDMSSDSLDVTKLDLDETYFVGIDLQEAMNHPGGKADLVLRDGDELIIPQLENTVKINGEVLYPNTVTYIAGKGLSYYINQAGGYAKESQKKQTYIIYNNGHVSRAKKGKIVPGCEIVVPTKKRRENTKSLATSLSVTTALATVAAVIVSALK